MRGTNITATYDDTAGTLTLNGQRCGYNSVVAGDGLTGGATSGDATLNLDATVAGDGLAHSSGVLSVTVDDSSIETNSDTLRVKATGVTNAMLAGSIANAKLANDSVTVNSQEVDLGAAITLTLQMSVRIQTFTIQTKELTIELMHYWLLVLT